MKTNILLTFIDAEIAKLKKLRSDAEAIFSTHHSHHSHHSKPAKRKISKAGLARIRAAQKKRWAEVKKNKK